MERRDCLVDWILFQCCLAEPIIHSFTRCHKIRVRLDNAWIKIKDLMILNLKSLLSFDRRSFF